MSFDKKWFRLKIVSNNRSDCIKVENYNLDDRTKLTNLDQEQKEIWQRCTRPPNWQSHVQILKIISIAIFEKVSMCYVLKTYYNCFIPSELLFIFFFYIFWFRSTNFDAANFELVKKKLEKVWILVEWIFMRRCRCSLMKGI